MSARGPHAMWLRPVAVIGCLVGLVTGCGSSTPPVEAVPALEARLSAVDSAIADHQYGQARRQIQRLVKTTVAARDAGELAPEEADPILAAAASLTSALPPVQRTPLRSPEPEPAPDVDEGEPPAPEPDPDAGLSEEEREKRQEELEKKREELEKKREELQKKLEEEQQKDEEEDGGDEGGEEGGGNGDSSENGPDDGHGN